MSSFYQLMMRKKGMPERYQEVEYIESSGTQYIDTGIKTNGSITIDCKLYTANQYGSMFGSRIAYGNKAFCFTNVTGWIRADYNNSAKDLAPLSSVRIIKSKYTETEYIFEDYNESEILVKSVTITKSNFTSDLNLYLFARNDNGTISQDSRNVTRIYYFKLYDNNRLVRNFIPVYDTLTQKYGMWESVQGKFYGNDGTGDFKGSIVGYTVVGSPTITDGVVSGFSSANYLTLPTIASNSYNRIEIKTRVTTGNSVNLDGAIIAVSNAYMQGVSLDFIKFTSRVNLGAYNSLSSNSISPNKNYDIMCIIDITNANLTLGIKETSQSVYVNNTIQIDTSNLRAIQYRIGNNDALGEFNGSIDMNETSIKVNNKLWFNGQQA